MTEKTPYARMPLWRLVDIATREMTENGKEYFTRQDIYDYIDNVLLKGDQEKKEPDSISPVIQGVTVNAPGGAPGAVKRRILYRVDRGLYRRCRDDETALPYRSQTGYPLKPLQTAAGAEQPGTGYPAQPGGRLIDDIMRSLEQEHLFAVRVEDDGSILLPEGVVKEMGLRAGDILVFQPLEGRKCLLKKGRLRLEINDD